VAENRVLRRFGPKGDEVTGEWRKRHNEELHKLHSLPSIIRMIESKKKSWVAHVARMRERRNACSMLVGKPEGRRPLGRPRCMCVDNVKMYLREIGNGCTYWIDLAQDKDPWRALVILNSCTTGGLSRRAQEHGLCLLVSYTFL
jgi:hypothetical protein